MRNFPTVILTARILSVKTVHQSIVRPSFGEVYRSLRYGIAVPVTLYLRTVETSVMITYIVLAYMHKLDICWSGFNTLKYFLYFLYSQ